MVPLLPLSLFMAAAFAGSPSPTVSPTSAVGMFHAIALVNDPMSHGAVGDGLLSLNEAIQLHNGTLLYGQLSATEQGQLSVLPGTGGTTDVSWIDIDGGATDVITIQQDLEPVLDTPAGLLIRGFGERPVLDFGGANLTKGLSVPANSIVIENLIFRGGPFGCDIVQSDASGQAGASFDRVTFDGQAQFGVRVAGGLLGGVGRLVLQDCAFQSVPSAIEYEQLAADRHVIFEMRGCEVHGAVHGMRYSGGTGGTARFTFDRCIVTAAVTGIEIDAVQSSGRPTLVEGNHLRVRAQDCVRIDAASDANTWMQCAMWHLFAPGGSAFEVGGSGADVFGDLNEIHCEGIVSIMTGGGGQPLKLRNARFVGGAVVLENSAAQPLLWSESRCTNCQVAASGVPVAVDRCCFVGGLLGTLPAHSAFLVTNSYVESASAAVQISASLPAPQLGSLKVTPDDVAVGSAIQFAVDLPPGLLAVLVLGVVPNAPPIAPAPYYVYVDAMQYVLVPGAYSLQQSYTWNVPAQSQFVGLDFVAQAIVLPVGSTQAPVLQMPPGWRFVLR